MCFSSSHVPYALSISFQVAATLPDAGRSSEMENLSAESLVAVFSVSMLCCCAVDVCSTRRTRFSAAFCSFFAAFSMLSALETSQKPLLITFRVLCDDAC